MCPLATVALRWHKVVLRVLLGSRPSVHRGRLRFSDDCATRLGPRVRSDSTAGVPDNGARLLPGTCSGRGGCCWPPRSCRTPNSAGGWGTGSRWPRPARRARHRGVSGHCAESPPPETDRTAPVPPLRAPLPPGPDRPGQQPESQTDQRLPRPGAAPSTSSASSFVAGPALNPTSTRSAPSSSLRARPRPAGPAYLPRRADPALAE